MAYNYQKPEEGASQYDDIDLKQQNIVEARYVRAVLEEDCGNPLIEAIPLPRSGNAIGTAYSRGIPGYSRDKVPQMSELEKKLQVSLLRTDVRFPLPFHESLEFNIYNAILISYRSRKNLVLKRGGFRYCINNEEESSSHMLIGDSADSTNAGCSLTGFSGCGKSSSVSITVSHYPKAIRHHDEYGYYIQIPVLVVVCEANSNFQALYHEFGRALDNALGNYFPSVYANEIDRIKGLGNKAAKVTELIERFYIGLIVFDEIQLLNFRHEQENSFDSLLTIANKTKVAMVFVGTEDARIKMCEELRIARRAGTDINGNCYCADRDYFGFLVNCLFSYQWFDKTVEVTEEITGTLFELTHGIVDQLIGLYTYMHYEYFLREKKPAIDSKFIRWVSKTYFPGIQDVLRNIGSPDAEEKIHDISKTAEAIYQMRCDEASQKKAAKSIIENSGSLDDEQQLLKKVAANIKAIYPYSDRQIEDAFIKVMNRKSSKGKTEQQISMLVVKQLEKENKPRANSGKKLGDIPGLNPECLDNYFDVKGNEDNDSNSK